MEAVDAIGFDLDHTLAIDNHLERVAFLRLGERVEAAGGAIGTLAEEIERIEALLARQRLGEFSIDEAVRRFVSDRGLTPTMDDVAAFRGMAIELVDGMVVAMPGVATTLARLVERGVGVLILSNGWNPLQEAKARRIGFPGAVLVSSEIGERKPSLGAFELLLRAMGTPAARSCYVGDDPLTDVEGARAAGMQTVWMDAEGKSYPAGAAAPGATIHTMAELLELWPEPVRAG